MARVHIGQAIMSICTKLRNKEHVMEDLCKDKFKSPGQQKSHSSKKWGFSKFIVNKFENMMADKQFILDGSGVKSLIMAPAQMVGPALMRALALSPPYSCPPINPTFLSKTKKLRNKNKW